MIGARTGLLVAEVCLEQQLKLFAIIGTMTDLTPVLNELLKGHDARPTANPTLTLQNIDEFLKEAYRIVSPIMCVQADFSYRF